MKLNVNDYADLDDSEGTVRKNRFPNEVHYIKMKSRKKSKNWRSNGDMEV